MENTVKGPKDAFTETVRTNTSLIRRHMRTPELRLYETLVGRRSLTNVTVAYIAGLTDPRLVEEMKRRLDAIDIDGFLSPSAVEEYVTGSGLRRFLCFNLRNGRINSARACWPAGWACWWTVCPWATWLRRIWVI